MNRVNRYLRIQGFGWLFTALFSSIFFISGTAYADNKDENGIPWYQIEVIIFANQNYLGLSSETWPDPSPVDLNNLIELRHPQDATLWEHQKLPNFSAGMPTPYQLLKKSELQLVPVARKLKSARNYQLLTHIGWRQPTLHPDKSQPVYVYQDIDTPMINDSVSNAGAVQQNQGGGRFSSVAVGSFTYDSSQYGQLLPVSQNDLLIGPAASPLSGTLRLSVSRYLHIESNLNYRMYTQKEEVVPVNANDTFAGGSFQRMVVNEQGEQAPTKIQKRDALQTFRLAETRRMRSREIHYLDHPVFGIVVRVIPYEIPKAEADFDPASQAFTTGDPSKK